MSAVPKPFRHRILPLFLLLLLTVITTAAPPPPPPPSDAVALLNFKSKADLANNLLYNLSDQLNHCHWQGVKCVQSQIVRLNLQSSGLTGTFPGDTLSLLTTLRILILNNNSLSGPIPNLSPLTNLKTLFLHHNSFSGTFPLSLTSLPYLHSLNLARNNLSGSLPVQLNSLPRLIILRLEHNRFTGSIPPLNQTGLQAFNVSFNNLTGSIPVTVTLSRFDTSAYSFNTGLCGKLVDRTCSNSTPFFDKPAGVDGVSPAPELQNAEAQDLIVSPPARRKHKRVGVILGFMIGVLLVLAVVLTVFAVLNQRSYRKRTKSVACSSDAETETENDNRNGNGRYRNRTKSVAFESDTESENVNRNGNVVVAISSNNTASAMQIVNKKGEIKEQRVQLPELAEQHRLKSGDMIFCDGETAEYGLEQLMSASAELLGRGTIGTTYKAVMENQMSMTVTVKRLDAVKTAVTSGEAFERHLELVGRLRHPNLVPVRAYFQAKDERLVIYDYQPNGSLFNLIHGSRSTRAKPLHWTSCLKIAEDIALGLTYIHQTSRLIHNNLKSSNVLLGPDFEACLTDYCLLVLADPTSIDEPVSTGYKAPELKHSFNRATTKSDVYAFGVLLLELLSGRLPSQHPHLVPEDMAEWVSAMRENDDMPNDDRLGMLAEVAGICSMTSPEQRPVMRQVLKMLQEIKETVCMSADNDYLHI